MTPPRKPAAFRLDPEPAPEKAQEAEPRAPRAVKGKALATVAEAQEDFFDRAADEAEGLNEAPPPPPVLKRGSRIGRIFLAAFGVLVSLAVGLWVDRLVRDLFARADWLGWLAFALAVTAGLALAIILTREAVALMRLNSVEKLRGRALEALSRDDQRQARAVVEELAARFSAHPETAAGRRALADTKDDIIDGRDLIGLAETELLGPLDRRAQTLILDAAKRVSVVTAVSPRALVDIAYVVFEAGRLVRRLAELYGARPGTLGFLRLSRSVLAHLAVTGAMAAGDEIVHQIVGQGLAARLSARLGEGVVNGMMTARIGVAAMETVRPLPFSALKRPGMGDFVSVLARFARRQGTGQADRRAASQARGDDAR